LNLPNNNINPRFKSLLTTLITLSILVCLGILLFGLYDNEIHEYRTINEYKRIMNGKSQSLNKKIQERTDVSQRPITLPLEQKKVNIKQPKETERVLYEEDIIKLKNQIYDSLQFAYEMITAKIIPRPEIASKALLSFSLPKTKTYKTQYLIIDESNAEFIFHNDENVSKRILKGFRANLSLVSNPNKLLEIKTNEIDQNMVISDYVQNIKPLDSSIAQIAPEHFRTFYILDVFNVKDSCSHGDKVYDVVVQTLTKYGFKDIIIEKIKKIPINYFNNIEYGKKLIQAYNKIFEDENEIGSEIKILPPSDSIENIYRNNFRYTSPNYMRSVISFCEKDQPDIISNSYSLQTPSITYPPAWTFTHNASESANTNYLASGTNDNEFIEKYKKATKFGYTEPYFSFLNSVEEFGVILVGNKVNTGKFGGMYSEGGKLMHTLGHGSNWGNDSTCIKQYHNGSSFATPEVATKLFIAKAYWRSKGLTVDPVEARNRVILATNLEGEFINKFSSAGTLSIEKLLQTDSAYLVNKGDSIFGLNNILKAHIIFNQSSIGYRVFETSTKDGIKGLYKIDNSWYAIFNDENKWIQISEPKDFIIVYADPSDNVKFISKEDFVKSYKQFVVLNKTE
jgi:hypothetical protein